MRSSVSAHARMSDCFLYRRCRGFYMDLTQRRAEKRLMDGYHSPPVFILNGIVLQALLNTT